MRLKQAVLHHKLSFCHVRLGRDSAGGTLTPSDVETIFYVCLCLYFTNQWTVFTVFQAFLSTDNSVSYDTIKTCDIKYEKNGHSNIKSLTSGLLVLTALPGAICIYLCYARIVRTFRLLLLLLPTCSFQVVVFPVILSRFQNYKMTKLLKINILSFCKKTISLSSIKKASWLLLSFLVYQWWNTWLTRSNAWLP